MVDFAAWVADTIAHDHFLREIYRNGLLEPKQCALCDDKHPTDRWYIYSGLYLCWRCWPAVWQRLRRPRPARGRSPRQGALHNPKYALRKQAGLCGYCGQGPPKPNRVWCQACADRNLRSKLATATRRREQGRCVTCGARPPQADRLMCRACVVMKVAQRGDRAAVQVP